MLKEPVIVIAEESYLLRKGLIAIIKQINPSAKVFAYDSIEQIVQKIEGQKVDVLMVCNDIFSSLEPPVHQFLISRNDMKTVKLTHSRAALPVKENPVANNILFFFEEKERMVEQIEKIMQNKVKEKEEETEDQISEREKIILKYVALGLTNKEIADKLFLSAHTVITHRKNITGKLGIKTVAGLTVYAILNGLVSMDEIKK